MTDDYNDELDKHSLLSDAVRKYFDKNIVGTFGIHGNPKEGYKPYINLNLPELKDNISRLDYCANSFKEAITLLEPHKIETEKLQSQFESIANNLKELATRMNSLQSFDELKADYERKLQIEYTANIQELNDIKVKKEEEYLNNLSQNIDEEFAAKINRKISEAHERYGIRLTTFFKKIQLKLEDPLALIDYAISEIGSTTLINLEILEEIRNKIKTIVGNTQYTQELSDALESLDKYSDAVKSGVAKRGDKVQREVVENLRRLQWKLEQLVVPEKKTEITKNNKEETTGEETPQEDEDVPEEEATLEDENETLPEEENDSNVEM